MENNFPLGKKQISGPILYLLKCWADLLKDIFWILRRNRVTRVVNFLRRGTGMMSKQLTLQEINALDQESFVTALASLFEGPPWIVRQAWYARPFANLTELHQALCAVMYQAPVEQQVALILAHPDLVGRAALAGRGIACGGCLRPRRSYPRRSMRARLCSKRSRPREPG